MCSEQTDLPTKVLWIISSTVIYTAKSEPSNTEITSNLSSPKALLPLEYSSPKPTENLEYVTLNQKQSDSKISYKIHTAVFTATEKYILDVADNGSVLNNVSGKIEPDSSKKNKLGKYTNFDEILKNADLYALNDVLLGALKMEYDGLAITDSNNDDIKKYSVSLYSFFTLEFARHNSMVPKGLEDDFYNETFSKALASTKKTRGYSAVKLSAPMRRALDIIKAVISTDVELIQEICTLNDKTCLKKYLEAINTNEIQRCNNADHHALLYLQIIELVYSQKLAYKDDDFKLKLAAGKASEFSLCAVESNSVKTSLSTHTIDNSGLKPDESLKIALKTTSNSTAVLKSKRIGYPTQPNPNDTTQFNISKASSTTLPSTNVSMGSAKSSNPDLNHIEALSKTGTLPTILDTAMFINDNTRSYDSNTTQNISNTVLTSKASSKPIAESVDDINDSSSKVNDDMISGRRLLGGYIINNNMNIKKRVPFNFLSNKNKAHQGSVDRVKLFDLIYSNIERYRDTFKDILLLRAKVYRLVAEAQEYGNITCISLIRNPDAGKQMVTK